MGWFTPVGNPTFGFHHSPVALRWACAREGGTGRDVYTSNSSVSWGEEIQILYSYFFHWYEPSWSSKRKSSSWAGVVPAAVEHCSTLLFRGRFASVRLLLSEHQQGVISGIPIMFLIVLLTRRKSMLGKVKEHADRSQWTMLWGPSRLSQ